MTTKKELTKKIAENKRLREALGQIEVLTDEPFYNVERARKEINKAVSKALEGEE